MTIESMIKNTLTLQFPDAYFELVNESHLHNVPANSETHFKLTLVDESFNGKRQVVRHQLLYQLLAEALAGPVHALALHLYTPVEWQQQGGRAPKSPQCLGGSNLGGAK